MNLQKIILNAVVGSSLIAFLCCSGSKQITVAKNTEIEKEVNYIPYYLKVYEADSLYLTGNYERSFEILDSLFKEFEPLNYEYNELETYIKSAYLIGRTDAVKPFFKLLISKYGFVIELLSYDSILNSAYQAVHIDIKEYHVLKENFEQKINYALRDEIDEMYYRDQFFRKLNNASLKQNEEDSALFAHQWQISDKRNEEKLIYIFEKYGFPNSKLGCNIYVKGREEQTTDVKLLLMHTSDSLRFQYFLPKLLNFIKEGESYPRIYAAMIDQYNVYNGEPQIYGTFSNVELMYNKEKTDSLRKSIGLPKNLNYDKWRLEKIFKTSLP